MRLLSLHSVATVLAHPLRVLPGGADTTTPTDEELVALVQKGDRQAADALVGRHLDLVLLRATRLLGLGPDAEDAVQDAFCEALRDLNQLQDAHRFGAWVGKIAVHQVHRRFRRRRLRKALGLLSASDEQVLSRQVPDTSDPSVKAQLSEVDRILASHAPRDRLAWMLRHVEGLSLPEVAEQLGCSLATGKRSIARVQALLNEHFTQDIFPENEA